LATVAFAESGLRFNSDLLVHTRRDTTFSGFLAVGAVAMVVVVTMMMVVTFMTSEIVANESCSKTSLKAFFKGSLE
jgi:hypothetical protein